MTLFFYSLPLWLPILAIFFGLIPALLPSPRLPNPWAFAISLCSALCGCVALFPYLLSVQLIPPFGFWETYRLQFRGIWIARPLECFFGIVAGVWLGRILTEKLQKILERSGGVIRNLAVVLVCSALLYASYVPMAFLQDSLGGGSGYGAFVPGIFMTFFESTYFRLFSCIRHATGWGDNSIFKLIFSITGALLWGCGGWICACSSARKLKEDRKSTRLNSSH